jgi:hypothetical protein
MEQAIVQMMAVAPKDRKLDWLKKSLQAAIELELSTLPPYLCAMWSIKDTATGLPGGFGAVTTLIDSVVRQEMTHLGLVCNMLTGLGGTPALAAGYASNIKYPGSLPGGVRPELTVYLSGLTKSYVHDVFMEIEFPEKGPLALVMVGGHTFPTIGAFYDAIQEAFTQLSPLPSPARQLTSNLVNVSPILNLDDVAKAISLIKSQGEGSDKSPGDGQGDDLAHYYRFAELYVGTTLVTTPGGGFTFSGPALPFPDAQTMAPIPKGGYLDVSAEVTELLRIFNSLFSDMLDKLDAAWQNGDQAALSAGVTKMRQLKTAATNIMAKPLPKAVNGFYGPDFQYIPANQRTTQVVAAAANPTFSDITKLLETLTGVDPNIDSAPHGAFWKDDYDTFMAQKTSDWGVTGSLVVKGKPDQSVLYQALSGTGPFGTTIPQMPFLDLDPNGRLATSDELELVATWITNNCPK